MPSTATVTAGAGVGSALRRSLPEVPGPLRRHPAAGPAALTAAAFVVLAALRWLVAAHRDITRWILAERPFADPATVPHGLHVAAQNGYDGQFYYRIALDPLDLHRTAHGITLDSAERLGRIGYPALAWVVSLGGRPGLVPWALVVVNILALVAIAWVGALLAADSGRSPWWGLAFSGFCAFEFSFARDLCEPTAAAFALAALLALRRRRFLGAALLFTAAGLCRETALIYVGGWLAYRAYAVLRRRRPVGAPDLAWLVPLAGFGAWQLIVAGSYGRLPLTAASGPNESLPFVGLVVGVHHLLLGHDALEVLGLFHLAVLAVVLALTALVVRDARNPTAERVMWVVAVAFSTCIGWAVWAGGDDLRAFSELWFLSVLVLLGAPSRLRVRTVVAVVAAGTWLVGAAHWSARL